jgi:predicted naringenin-chalcone synthase
MTRYPKSPQVFLHQIATRVPEVHYTQRFALDFLLRLQGTTPRKRIFLEKVYANTGIEKRHTVIGDYGRPVEKYEFYPNNPDLKPEPETWYRNDRFIAEANRLVARTAQDLLTRLPDFDKRRITHLVTLSCTGFSVPGFDIHLVKILGLNRDVHRFHIGFMGCYAAFPAMKLARDICLAHEEATVLVVGVELCSLHFQQKFTPETVVANAIFADGAAAALISASPSVSDRPKLRLDRFATYLVDNSEEGMAWRIGKHGFDMRLSLYVPAIIEANIRGVVSRLLDGSGVSLEEIDLFAVHPGGRAILDKVRDALSLPDRALDSSYDVLREYGNMSSVTIFFVLEAMLSVPASGRIFAAAFGPGLTVESGILTKEGRQ